MARAPVSCELRVCCTGSASRASAARPTQRGSKNLQASGPSGLSGRPGFRAVRAFGPSGLSGRPGFRAAALFHSWTRGQADGRWDGWVGGCTAAFAESICTLTRRCRRRRCARCKRRLPSPSHSCAAAVCWFSVAALRTLHLHSSHPAPLVPVAFRILPSGKAVRYSRFMRRAASAPRPPFPSATK